MELKLSEVEELLRNISSLFRYTRDFYLIAKDGKQTLGFIEEYYKEIDDFNNDIMCNLFNCIKDRLGTKKYVEILSGAGFTVLESE
jgi:hypothetical protein